MSTALTTFSKVFVGNLSFKTKANELAAEFSAAGKVVSTNIITRGTRSLGYGFVEMENDEAAHKSVSLLNKKSIDGREINVEVARPRDEAKLAERRAEREKSRAERGPRSEQGSNSKRRRAPRRRGPETRVPRTNGDAATSAVATSSPSTPVRSETPASDRPERRAPRRRASSRKEGEAPSRQAPSGDATAASPSSPSSPSAPKRRRSNKGRGPRAPRNSGPKIASTTTLFVANLPFALKDEGFVELFKDTGAVNAHVVLNKNGRSKGFGFVEYVDEVAQLAALKKLTEAKLVSGERPLSVKIAWNPPVVQDAAASTATTSAPTAETPTPTPTPTSA